MNANASKASKTVSLKALKRHAQHDSNFAHSGARRPSDTDLDCKTVYRRFSGHNHALPVMKPSSVCLAWLALAPTLASATGGRSLSQVLTELWRGHDHPHYIDKWLEYSTHYEAHLPRPGAGPTKLLEIGVQSGGSLVAWSRYYGANGTIVGIDIDPRCTRSHDPGNNVFVEIGSQLDTAFLDAVCTKHGPFDAIVDDGGHTDTMITTSLFHMFPSDACLKRDGGVYAVEDVHTMVMKRYMVSHASITRDVVGKAYHSMHAHWDASTNKTTRHASKYSSVFRDNVVAMHLYDSHIFLVKGRVAALTRNKRGNDSFSNDEGVLNKAGTYYSDK